MERLIAQPAANSLLIYPCTHLSAGLSVKRPDHEKSPLGHVPPGTLASSSERLTKKLVRQLHT